MFTVEGLRLMWPLWIGTAVYGVQLFNLWRAGQPEMGMVYLGYSIANIALIAASTRDFS